MTTLPPGLYRLEESAARVRLELMLQADAEPPLDEENVDDLLDLCRRMDAAGNAPSAAGWEATWDLNMGAAEGWRRKAGLVAGRFSFSADGQAFQRQQAFEHCLDMARMYAARVGGSISLVHEDSDFVSIDLLGN